jgi:Phage integrase SAM-like domain
MPRPATGTIVERRNSSGSISRMLRFSVNGKKRAVSLGEVSREEAERRLGQELSDVQRGNWTPPVPVLSPRADVPTFHAFAEEWWTRNEGQLAPKTETDYRWRLEKHLLKFFGEPLRLDEITFDTIERYIAFKLGEDRPLSARSINMTVILLPAILESAVDRELIGRNPAKGKRRQGQREGAPSVLSR